MRPECNSTPDSFEESEAEKDKIVYPGHHHWNRGSVDFICWYAYIADGRVLHARYIRKSADY